MNPTKNKKQHVSEAVRKHKEFLFPAVATYYQEPLALVKGEGEYVWDDAGNRYLDCFGGVLTVSVGHANPKINAAIIEQVNKIAAHFDALRQPAAGRFGGKAGGNHARRFEEIVFYLDRHRSRRHGDYGGETRHRADTKSSFCATVIRAEARRRFRRSDIRRGDRCRRRLPESSTPARLIVIAARLI